jgi:hypothetical protein
MQKKHGDEAGEVLLSKLMFGTGVPQYRAA